MEILELFLILMAAVLVSAVLGKPLPGIPPALVQVALGFVIALLLPERVGIPLDPELVLTVLIAPLIYIESKELDRKVFKATIVPVLVLAIVLVVVTAVIAGWAMAALFSLPFLVALTIGGALSPTDPVAVASLAKGTNIPTRTRGILAAESLANDATGLVMFQCAIAAALTGALSIPQASLDFCYSFFGGIITGGVIGLVANGLLRAARRAGIGSPELHVAVEVLAPFFIYLMAVLLGTSGILAVMTAGLINIIDTRREPDDDIRSTDKCSHQVWRMLSFMLNGVVFTLLGTQIPAALAGAWFSPDFSWGYLIVAALALFVVIQGVRFVFLFVMMLIRRRKAKERSFAADTRLALLMALAGSKGTITFASLLSIPATFSNYEMVSFLIASVILLSLVVAMVTVPRLAPKD